MLDEHIPNTSDNLGPPPLDFHKEWCASAFRPQPVPRKTMREIAVEVCRRHQITMADLTGERRTRPIAWARHEFMALAYELPHTSDPMIGRFLNRDHTTCLYGRRAYWKRCLT